MHPAISQVEAYWHGLRERGALPLRSDIDPRGISGALEYTFILEKIAPGLARFRLAGMHLNDLMGMEVRGMPLTSFFVPEARRTITDRLTRVFEVPEILQLTLHSERGIGKPALAGEMILLPLRSDLGDVSRALGCLATEGSAGRAPRRFAIGDVRANPVGAQKAKENLSAGVSAGFAEGATPFQHEAARPTPHKPPNLRLIKSDD